MNRPIIAVDIDDVLANSTDSLRREVNKRLGVDLQPEHYRVPGEYWAYYERVWQAHGLGGQITMDELDPQMKADQSHVFPHDNAYDVLQELSKRFKLVVVTSRNQLWEKATAVWLERHFPGVFSDLLFAGRHDVERPQTKGEMCREVGASWLIDDNIGHCQTALDAGVKVVLFGSYGWHLNVPDTMVRCSDWHAVKEYFNRQG